LLPEQKVVGPIAVTFGVVFSKMLTLSEVSFTTARSGLVSPFRSDVITPKGVTPVENRLKNVKVPVPLPIKIEALPLEPADTL